MLAVLDRSDSWVAAYAVPKLETASVRDAVSSSFANPMPYPCVLAGTAVNAAIWTAFSQKLLNAAKSIALLGSSPRRIHALYSLPNSPVRDTNVDSVLVGDWMPGEAREGNAAEEA